MELSGPGEVVNAVEKFYAVTDTVIRSLTVKIDKKPVPVRPAVEAVPATDATATAPVAATATTPATAPATAPAAVPAPAATPAEEVKTNEPDKPATPRAE